MMSNLVEELCKQCGGPVIEDIINASEKLVCSDCGFFVEGTNLVSSNDYTNKNAPVYKFSCVPKPKCVTDSTYTAKGKLSGKETVKYVCCRLGMQPYLAIKAVSLFEKIYEHKTVKYVHSDLKNALGASCAFSVARDAGINVTLKSLRSIHNANWKLYNRSLKLIKEITHQSIKNQPLSSLASHILAPAKFDIRLVHKISQLIVMCEQTCVTQGFDHSNVVIALAHIVWISEDVVERRYLSLKKFCSQHNISFTRNSQLISKSVVSQLISFTQQIPWVTQPSGINKRTVYFYLDSVIEYRRSLANMDKKNECDKTIDNLDDAVQDQVDYIPCANRHDGEDILDDEFCDDEISSYILSAAEIEVKKRLLSIE